LLTAFFREEFEEYPLISTADPPTLPASYGIGDKGKTLLILFNPFIGPLIVRSLDSAIFE
jgi:hypothetical protein